jgi:diaminopimelate epimerase
MLTFWKYHGLGNDFVMFDGREESSSLLHFLTPKIIQSLCDRHIGVGADGVIVAGRASDDQYRMTYFNADGYQAEMCGNGLRCTVALLQELGEDMTRTNEILTGNSVILAQAMPDGSVRNTMPSPRFRGFEGIPSPTDPELISTINFEDRQFKGVIVSIGNPHFVVPRKVTLDELLTWGPIIEIHPEFPDRTNVQFVEFVDRSTIRLQVWERGVGRTLACGSGATASAVAAVALGKANAGQDIAVQMDGGTLSVNVSLDFRKIWLQGPAQFVFEGELTREGGWNGLVS